METPLVPTTGSKIRIAMRDVELKNTLDGDGNKVVLRLKKLATVVIAPLTKMMPFVTSDGDKRKASERLKSMSDEDRVAAYAQSIEVGKRILVAACVNPRFAPFGAEPTAEEADVNALDDEDVMDATDVVYELCGIAVDDKEASTTKDFRDGNEGGGTTGVDAGATGEVAAQP